MEADTKLIGGVPVVGFGTWEMSGTKCAESVEDAIRLGYRHIDTAQMYNNESEVGRGIRGSGETRENIFVTTKIATGNLTPSRIGKSTEESLKNLDMEYVDLLLIHWPTEEMDLSACLESMFALKEENKVRDVGVSNFDPDLFQEAIKIGPVLTNQVKFTPTHGQFENLEVAKVRGKVITAYSPLDRGKAVKNTMLKKIGDKYEKTASQVALRWLIQLGNVSVIPKAQSRKHREENLDIFNFELSDEEMEQLNARSVGETEKMKT